MASTKLGPLLSDIRGSVGGTTFARNLGGIYVRVRIKPLNPRSNLQQLRRAGLATVAANWGQLSSGERNDWQAYAVNTSWTNRLGESINIKGEAAYVRLGAFHLTTGQVLRDPAPTAYGHASATVATFTASAATQTPILAAPTAGWDKDVAVSLLSLFAGMPQPGSREMAPVRWRYLQSLDGHPESPPEFPYTLDVWPWTYVAGQRLALAMVHRDPNFRLSIRSIIYCIAT